MPSDYYTKPRVTTDSPLARVRRARGLTQQQLSDATGVGHATISAIERGTREPSVRTLKRLAAVLGCDTKELM